MDSGMARRRGHKNPRAQFRFPAALDICALGADARWSQSAPLLPNREEFSKKKKKVWSISSQFLRYSISDIYFFLKEHENSVFDNIALKS